MRILAVSNLYPPHHLGGYGLLCKQVIDRLAARGHQLCILTSTHGSGRSVALEDGTRVWRICELDVPFPRPGRVARVRRWRFGRANAARFHRVFDEERPDLVVLWSQLRLTLGCARAAEARDVPVVYMLNDENIRSYLPAPWRPDLIGMMRYLTDRTLFRSTTLRGLHMRHAAVISQCTGERLDRQGVHVQNVLPIYQGIPLHEFPPKRDPGAMHRPARILYVGQLQPYKGVHVLVEAFARLVARRGEGIAELSVLGAGDPDYEQRLVAAAPPGARFVGRVEHHALPAAYRAHDVFVFPSTWDEPFGLTHLEAMASGTTVVSTTRGGPGEFLIGGDNALTVPSDDPDALCGALGRLLERPDLSRHLAVRARQVVEERFSLDRYVADLERLYARVVSESGERSMTLPIPARSWG